MASGTINGTVSNRSSYFSFYVKWSSTPNTNGNYSDVTVTSYWKTNNTGYTFNTVGDRSAYIIINGTKTAISKVFNCNPWPSGGVYAIQTATARVYHETDGYKSITISAYADGYASSYGPSGSSASGTATLDTIPRASSVLATSANIEEVSTITIKKASTSFTHTLSYGTGTTQPSNWTQIVSKTTAGSYAWTLPSSLYSLCPGSSITVWIKCDTYNGSTNVGTAYCSLTATTSINKCAPGLSVSWNYLNNCPSNYYGENTIIRYWSQVTAAITPTAKNGATITETGLRCTDGQGAKGTDCSIYPVGTGSFSAYTKDSRGYNTSQAKEYNIIPYIVPTVSLVASRTGPTTGIVHLNITGLCYTGKFNETQNTITVKYKYQEVGGSWSGYQENLTATLGDNSYTVSQDLLPTFDYQKQYNIMVYVADLLHNGSLGTRPTATATIGKGIPVFDWGEDDFNFNVPVNFTKGMSESVIPRQALTLVNCTDSYGSEYNYVKKDELGRVDVMLRFMATNTTGEHTVTTVPTGYRPKISTFLLCYDTSGSIGYAYINTSGIVTIRARNAAQTVVIGSYNVR